MSTHPALLKDLIKHAAETRGYRDLADEAVDPETGTQASLRYLNRLGRGAVDRIPAAPHLRAIAAALNVPYETVWWAAVDQWMPPPPEVLLARAERAADAAHKVLATERRRHSA